MSRDQWTKSFLRSIRQQAEAPTAPPPVRSMPVTFETFETPVSDSGRVAAAITKAAARARSGGPPLPELSATAAAILRAGERRRGG